MTGQIHWLRGREYVTVLPVRRMERFDYRKSIQRNVLQWSDAKSCKASRCLGNAVTSGADIG